MPYPLSLNLASKQTQSLKQTQRLMMSPQMQQAILLLQLPIQELEAAIELEIEQNPVLEYSQEDQLTDDEDIEPEQDTDSIDGQEVDFDDRNFEILKQIEDDFKEYITENGSSSTLLKWNAEDEKKRSYLENSIEANSSLFEYLVSQSHEVFETEIELKAAETLIGHLTHAGFLETELKELTEQTGIELKVFEKVLAAIQTFEPFGVGARDLRESMLIQLKCQKKDKSLAYEIIDKHFDDLLHNRIPVIKKALKKKPEEIRHAIEHDIAFLDLHPGTTCSKEAVPYIIPDATIKQDDEKLIIQINDETLPPLRLNENYLKMLEDQELPTEIKEFIKKKVLSARWLLKNINQRHETLHRITECLIEKQKSFFTDPQGKLLPLTMKTVSEELNLHESTIARAVSNKYLDTPRGLLPLRSFFSQGYVSEQGEDVSSTAVRELLLELIKHEDRKKPLSDEALSNLIKKEGIPCARRTIAKYRALLKIGNASQRKKF